MSINPREIQLYYEPLFSASHKNKTSHVAGRKSFNKVENQTDALQIYMYILKS